MFKSQELLILGQVEKIFDLYSDFVLFLTKRIFFDAQDNRLKISAWTRSICLIKYWDAAFPTSLYEGERNI